ncbi:hypothetical protein KUV51_18155 [Tateyamaria omphalii]|uniref:hypothetical protein n=1 Tax=Tateyamaria omphalii TaxID=299262 RepID=UPI001C9995DE|nr:hypothetical protein [Tateyamaria omphalii]MBY5934932.1 hypothetical protein [Tateyamaria omphalii]
MTTREPSRFLRWYLSSMASFVPEWIRAACMGRPMARTCHFVDGKSSDHRHTLPASLLVGGKKPSAASSRNAIDAVVPERLFLTRRVSLPRKAAARMLQIGTLDIAQKTPLQADEITWAVGPVLREKDHVQMTQVIALNSDLVAWRERMDAANRPLRRVYARVCGRDVLIADFEKATSPYARLWPVFNLAGATIAFACALYLWALPGLQAADRVARLTSETDRLQAQALELRRQVESQKTDEERQQRILSAVSDAPLLFDAVVAATTALPDSVWVSQYIFDPSGVRMFAEVNGSAVDLLYALAEQPLLPNAIMQGDIQATISGTEEFWLLHDHVSPQ